jgi:hypothetical protein
LRPSNLAVEIVPSEQVLPILKSRGIRSSPPLTMNLRVTGDQLRILSVSAGNRTTPIQPGDTMSMFNAFACPA